ncbi:MAG: hypothetical protein Q8K96_01685 [Rubrivivax sp.]|nr:hypothetical protein [Rubrivivax sp.]
MSVVIVPGTPSRPHEGLRTLTHILYGLHLLSWFSAGIFSIVAVIINYVKRPDLPDDFFRSHFRWQARSFWFTLLWLALSAPLFLFFWFPGAAAWFVVGLWYLYRFIRGWLAFMESRPMPLPAL